MQIQILKYSPGTTIICCFLYQTAKDWFHILSVMLNVEQVNGKKLGKVSDRLTILRWKHNNTFSVLLLLGHMWLLTIKKFRAVQQYFMVNLRHRQQCKLYVPVFERN
jgi:hypothetical protein